MRFFYYFSYKRDLRMPDKHLVTILLRTRCHVELKPFAYISTSTFCREQPPAQHHYHYHHHNHYHPPHQLIPCLYNVKTHTRTVLNIVVFSRFTTPLEINLRFPQTAYCLSSLHKGNVDQNV